MKMMMMLKMKMKMKWLTNDVNQEIKLDGEVGKLLEAARKERRALEKELNDVREKKTKIPQNKKEKRQKEG